MVKLYDAQSGAPLGDITDEQLKLTSDALDFLDLDNQALNAGVSASPAAIVDEAVGTGDGLLGDVQGDFELDYKVRAVADVTSVTGCDERSTERSGRNPPGTACCTVEKTPCRPHGPPGPGERGF